VPIDFDVKQTCLFWCMHIWILTNIGSLGENAARDTGKESNRRCAKTKSSQGIGSILNACIKRCVIVTESDKVEHERDSKKAESYNCKSHDGASSECHAERLGESFLVGSLSGPDIGIGCNDHATPSCSCRKHGTGRKASSIANAVRVVSGRRIHSVENEKSDKYHNNKCGQILVLGD
jgi:hypothetical protein